MGDPTNYNINNPCSFKTMVEVMVEFMELTSQYRQQVVSTATMLAILWFGNQQWRNSGYYYNNLHYQMVFNPPFYNKIKTFWNMNYYHVHGFNINHDSFICLNTGLNHIWHATYWDTYGGYNKNTHITKVPDGSPTPTQCNGYF